MREDQIASVRQLIDFLNEGLEEADAFSRDLLALPPSEWDGWLADHPRARSFATFRTLLDVAPQTVPVTTFVTRHVSTLSVPPEGEEALRYQRFLSWHGHARALRAAKQGQEALAAYERAAEYLRGWFGMHGQLREVERERAVHRASLEPPPPPDGPPGEALRLLEETPSEDWPDLAGRDELKTRRGHGDLSHEIVARANRNPAEALRISDLASAIADGLSPERYSPLELARIRGCVKRDRALPLRILARYPEALAELAAAEEILEPFDALAYETALVQLSRAVTLQEAGNYPAAAAALAACRWAIEAHGDERMQLVYRILEASLPHRAGNFKAARAAWMALLPVAIAVGDEHLLRSTHNSLAYTLIDLGELASAEEHLQEAVRLSTGQPIHVLRSELARGKVMLKQGAVEESVAHLQAVREQFLEHGLIEEAGLCGLEIVDAELERGSAEAAPIQTMCAR